MYALSAVSLIVGLFAWSDFTIADFVADLRAPTPSAAAELAVPLLSEVEKTIERTKDELIRSIYNKLDNYKLLVKNFSSENLELRFRSIEQPLLQRFEDAKESLVLSMNDLINQRKQQLKFAINTLEQISPKSILERGFSLVFNEEGKLLKDVNQAQIGDKITINLAKGKIFATTNNLEA